MSENLFASKMTQEIANFIKERRVAHDYTWRMVGWMTHVEFPELGIKPIEEGWVSQLDGLALCEAAMDFLGEDVSDGWN